MKKTICLILSVLLCISCFCGCQTAEPEVPTQPSTSTVPNRGRLSVLFIGNSYTYYNNMPTLIFDKIARAAGFEPNVLSVTCGNYSLEQHADPQNTYGLQVASYLLPKNINMFDYVVMQEQSQRPSYNNRAPFYDAVRTISSKAQAVNAKPILYSTWGRRSDSKDLKSMGLTNESMTWRLAAGYSAIGEELNIPVGHVGLAFYEVYTGSSGIELYDDDATHPSYAGSYLAAMTLFAKMTGIDPTTVDFVGELTAADADVLKQAAKNAVFNTPQIPEEYRTSSAGVTNSQ